MAIIVVQCFYIIFCMKFFLLLLSCGGTATPVGPNSKLTGTETGNAKVKKIMNTPKISIWERLVSLWVASVLFGSPLSLP